VSGNDPDAALDETRRDERRVPVQRDEPFPTFEVQEDARPLTLEHVRCADEEP
jgi:hypothetical protein